MVQARLRLLLGLHPHSRVPLGADTVPEPGQPMPTGFDAAVRAAEASGVTAATVGPAGCDLIVTPRLVALQRRVRAKAAASRRRLAACVLPPKRRRLRGKQPDPAGHGTPGSTLQAASARASGGTPHAINADAAGLVAAGSCSRVHCAMRGYLKPSRRATVATLPAADAEVQADEDLRELQAIGIAVLWPSSSSAFPQVPGDALAPSPVSISVDAATSSESRAQISGLAEGKSVPGSMNGYCNNSPVSTAGSAGSGELQATEDLRMLQATGAVVIWPRAQEMLAGRVVE